MEFKELRDEQFKNFVDNSDLKSFYQTKEMDDYSHFMGYKSYYVGVIDNDKVVGATRLISKKNKFGLNYFYAPRGILLDYSNNELLKFFTYNLKKYIKSKKGFVLHMDPFIIYKSRDIDGNITQEIDNSALLENLKKLGYKHGGLTKGYDLSGQGRWYFILDIKNKSIEDIQKGMKQNHRNIVRKAIKYGVEVKEIEYKDLNLFKSITQDTSNRIGFSDKSLKYYQTMYKAFKDKVKFLVAYLNKEKYQNQLKEELKTNINKYDNLIDKTTGKAKELKITIEGIKKRLDESNKYKEDMIPISAAMFMLYGSEISYLFSGSLEKYKNLYAQYLIQWYMIEFAVKNKYDTYNFFGISGIFDKKDKEYGVYEFKKGFGGNVVELIGDFDLPISIFYNINKIIKKFR